MGRLPVVEVAGVGDEIAAVAVSADEYVPFDRLTPSQQQLRQALRSQLSRLHAGPGQVLHATFSGAKRPRSDVEHLLLYNIDSGGASFASAARHGLRFELGPTILAGRESAAYRYSYELVSRGAGFEHWRPVRRLARWGWTELGALAGEKKLEQAWLALSRAAAIVSGPVRDCQSPFSVRVRIRPPLGRQLLLPPLVKGVFDGVICAFQAHSDPSTVRELARRVVRNIPMDADEVEQLLFDRERAVLGSNAPLLRRGEGVAWAPSDDHCVAGELAAEAAVDESWASPARLTN